MAEAVLEVQDLHKSFGALKASDGISLDLLSGEIHALIGPNGAGKSTLVQQIAGSLQPDSGTIRFMGKEVASLDVAARARLGLARTFQISALAMEDTVLDNVLLTLFGASGGRLGFFKPVEREKELVETAMNALNTVDLAVSANSVVAELSHGERRQLEVGIALAAAPRAFMMDEPMAGIGIGGTKKLMTLLEQLREQAPILLIEHDMDAVFALADRVSVLVYGRIIASGTVDEIRNDQEVRRAYLGDGEAA
jgi:branched-chain amino acid transport system ATP-binding protein